MEVNQHQFNTGQIKQQVDFRVNAKKTKRKKEEKKNSQQNQTTEHNSVTCSSRQFQQTLTKNTSLLKRLSKAETSPDTKDDYNVTKDGSNSPSIFVLLLLFRFFFFFHQTAPHNTMPFDLAVLDDFTLCCCCIGRIMLPEQQTIEGSCVGDKSNITFLFHRFRRFPRPVRPKSVFKSSRRVFRKMILAY